MGYTYDAVSQLTSLTYPDQSTVTYDYDQLSRLVTIPGFAEFAYTADSLLATATYGNGVTTTYQYNNRDRTIAVHAQKNDTDLFTMMYQYDPAGNITQKNYNRRSSNQQWVESVETFSYDWLDRLISAQGDYGSLSYTYDAMGNRLSQNGVTYTYSNMNELLSITDGTVFTYDEMGNTLTKTHGVTNWSYTYDERNLLEQIVEDQQVVGKYGYDGTGKRISKTEWIESLQDYQTTLYIYSGFDVVYEKNLDTGQEATYVYGPSGRIAKKVSGLTDYYHTDHLGSTRLITDEFGNVITDVEYTPFGESMVNGQEDSYLYTGKEIDSSGLYYYGARYYDSKIGRFITRDPLIGDFKDPQSLNRYIYCSNNPLKYVDPWGEKKFWIEGGGDEEEKELEEIDPHDSETGKYFEDEDGDGFIYIESNIQKYGNVGVATGCVHEPGSPSDPVHGLVVITYDCLGNVLDTEFISFTDLLDENSGALDDLVKTMEDQGLKDDLAAALDALQHYCDRKGTNAAVEGIAGGVAGYLTTKCGLLGAAANPIGAIIGVGAAIYFAARGGYWNNNENVVDEIEDDII